MVEIEKIEKLPESCPEAVQEITIVSKSWLEAVREVSRSCLEAVRKLFTSCLARSRLDLLDVVENGEIEKLSGSCPEAVHTLSNFWEAV